MKFKEFLQENEEAMDISSLLDSVHGGKFTLDGSKLPNVKNFFGMHLMLISLKGSPKVISGDFECGDNDLEDLRGSPKVIGGNFYCEDNKLTSLVGADFMKLSSAFVCHGNRLENLKGAPKKIGGFFQCSENRLTSLEGIPEHIGKYVDCSVNQLQSLEGIHKHIKQMRGTFYADDNPITSHVLGLLKIPGCDKVVLNNKNVEKIINKYLPLGDILDCQEELIEAGFEEFAQL